MTTTAICTVFEKDYHFGVAVLVNSLYNQGFRGIFWVGYRGELPPWANNVTDGKGYQELKVAEGCVIRFIKLITRKHLAFYKPDFMWQLMENYCPEVDVLFYFDPDIVNKINWKFYENWVSRGIALCGDCWYEVPFNHPHRLAWQEFASIQGWECDRNLDHNYNSGFIGVPKNLKHFILLWQKLIEAGEAAGYANLEDVYASDTVNFYPYLHGDQTYLNLALMVSSVPITTVGPDGMDFVPGGMIMSHAISPSTKPWRKKLIKSALQAQPPTVTDKLYWQQAQTPIQVYSNRTYKWNKFALRVGSAIGRFMRRSAM